MGKRLDGQKLPIAGDGSESSRSVEKNILMSRSFKDGAIYLFVRADYKKPTWMCRVRVPGVSGYTTRSTRTTNEHEAYKFADDLYHEILVKVRGGANLNSKRISEAIENYSTRFKRDEDQLSVRYRIQFLERCKPFFDKKTFADLNTSLFDKLFDHLSETSAKGLLSANTIKRQQSDLKNFLNWCVEEAYLPAVPKFPRLKSKHSRRPHFDPAAWRKLARHLREFLKVTNGKTLRDRMMLRDYVLILANTGIRGGEARNLKWRDIREVRGDGSTNIVLMVSGKTGQREVVASKGHVSTYFKRIFELRCRELTKIAGKATDPSADDLVFCHPDGSPILSFKKSFASLLKSAGVETDTFGQRRTIYSLRHTYATFRLQEGVNHYTLAKNMGTSVAMLEKHYGHTSNVAAADELTKRKVRSPRSKGPPTGKPKSALDWLKS